MKWQEEEMQNLNKGKSPECNVIFQAPVEPACPPPGLDFGDPAAFHRRMLEEQGLLPQDSKPQHQATDGTVMPTSMQLDSVKPENNCTNFYQLSRTMRIP